MIEGGGLRMDPATRQVWRGDDEISLSTKEFALLEAFMRRPGEVLSRYQLLEHAWDYEYENRSNVVDVYVRYLRQKIDLPFGTDTIETVRGAGYRLRKQARHDRASCRSVRGSTAAFAAAMILVLALAGAFVYLKVRSDLTEALEESLDSRADDVAALASAAGSLDARPRRRAAGGRRGQLRAGARSRAARSSASTLPASSGAAITPTEAEAAAGSEPLVSEREVPSIDGEAKLLARSVADARRRIDGRRRRHHPGPKRGPRRAHRSVSRSAGRVAILLASLLGYLLAGRALAPVESMRRRAAGITLERSGERLPLPRPTTSSTASARR